jgi:DNA polymerase-3 subunit gamma/tau
MDRAIASVEQDGFVREVIEMFDATLVESSIKPV